MADTDDLAAAASAEARRARHVVERDVQQLQGILASLGYREDLRSLDQFSSRFAEYRRLDDEILPLAAENTNVKAQRLSFGPAREAVDAFRSSMDAAARTGATKDTCRAEAVAARAQLDVLEIEVAHARHIAEAEDAAMTRMEGLMTVSAADARKALDELRTIASPQAARQLDAAAGALDRFMSVHKEIITLSRRNNDVRSLALSLGRKRTVSAECEAQLQVLEEVLAQHQFTATR